MVDRAQSTDNNAIRTLPKGIAALRSLGVLDLEGNKLEYLATEISYLRELQKLNVQSNRITHLQRSRVNGLHVLAAGGQNRHGDKHKCSHCYRF